MPIAADVLSPRLREVGRLRIGEKLTKKVVRNGKPTTVTYPSAIETFRFTSKDEAVLIRVADHFGGDVEAWDNDGVGQFQVVTEHKALEVVLPRAEMALSQWLELWSAGGCKRRCDGHRETISDGACLCNPADRECDPHTRLSVMLPELPGIGLWRVDTQSWNAAAEILGAVMVANAYGAEHIPARLLVEFRDGKKDGKKTHFPVIALDLNISQRELTAAARRRALGAGTFAELNPDPRDDAMRKLQATFREVYPKGATQDDVYYREERLGWSSAILGRLVTTWNGPESPNELSLVDVLTLQRALDESRMFQPDQVPGVSPDVIPGTSAGPALTSGPAGISEGEGEKDAPVSGKAPEDLGSPLPSEGLADGPGPGTGNGPDAEGARAEAGAKPVNTEPVTKPSASARSRPKPDLRAAQAEATQARQQFQETERVPTDVLHTLPPAVRDGIVKFFEGDLDRSREIVERAMHMGQGGIAMDQEWPQDRLARFKARFPTGTFDE